jgi:hypothetical protein
VAVQGAAVASTDTVVSRQDSSEVSVMATGVSTSADGCTTTETSIYAFRVLNPPSGSYAFAEYYWSSLNACTGESDGGYGRTFGQPYNYPGFVMTVARDSARLVVDISTSDGAVRHVDETWSPTGPPVTKTVTEHYVRDTFIANYRYTGRLRPATVTGSAPVSSGFFGTLESGSVEVAQH